ncbi:Ig-like domain repeat protein [uncultured Methanobrevibacter sp.]|uniref:Ig-like domain repeat protein n=1 Tax=uncultured Methanobrevibacter sp. TaxID=253161 RepID=UPI00261608F7|nr:Ig-like domain repeat protein [uncultured Methanobrevibacter sp.]
MKFNKLMVVLFISICIMLCLSSVSATDFDNETTVECQNINLESIQINDDSNCIYVDGKNGSYYSGGTSWSNATKTLDWALHIAKENSTIYIANGTYSGSENVRINITKSVTIVGSGNTVFDGLNKNYLFTVCDGVTVNIVNITFINAFKKSTSMGSQCYESMYGAAIDVKKATVTITNCIFRNNRIEQTNGLNKANYGGAVSNQGNMIIRNSTFYGNSMTSEGYSSAHGADVYNGGNLTISDSSFEKSYVGDFALGGSISNEGNLILNRIVISDCDSAQQVKGSAFYNGGNCTIINSTIKNSKVNRAVFNTLYGVVYNEGSLIATGCVFANNSGIKDSGIPTYKGSVNIYNVGDVNLTYCAFLDNNPLSGTYADFFEDGGGEIYLDYNWWGSNTNPFKASKINADKINSWITLNVNPDYLALNIDDSADITASWKLSDGGSLNIGLFPLFNVSFNTWVNGTQKIITKQLVNGYATINYNWTQKKGTYIVLVSAGGFTKEAIVDVGKLVSNIKITVDDINYTQNLTINIEVTGIGSLTPQGNVSVIIDGKTYTLNLVNGKATFVIPKLLAGNYTFNVVYNGDKDYFRAFASENVTVNKCRIYLNISTPEIKIGETGKLITFIIPDGVQIYARLYVNGVVKRIISLYSGETTIILKNYGVGVYNITVETFGDSLQNQLYEMASASSVFKVSKYDTNLTVNVSDVKSGEDAVISIKIDPKDVIGEAILIINGRESKIFLNDEITNITLSDLSSGKYNVTVIYKGDSKYASSNASASFSVLKEQCNLTVDIVQNEDFTGVITVKTNPNNCTGIVGVYVNNVFYQLNLINGVATCKVNFTRGNNYIYVYYSGDRYFDNASWNTTIEIMDKCILTGENIIMIEGDGSKYTVQVTDLQENPFTYVDIIMEINGKTYTVTTNNVGKASLLIDLPAGNYTISVTYSKTTIYNNITVKPLDFNLTVDNVQYGEDVTIKANFNALINGTITFVIKNHLNTTVKVIQGKASYKFNGLGLGSYTVYAIYNNKLTKSATFSVIKSTPVINVDIKDVLAGQDEIITATLPKGATGEIIFVVDGVIYTKTLNNAVASVTIQGLTLGSHTLKVIYKGDNNFNENTFETVFNIKNSLSTTVLDVNNTIYGDDIIVIASITSGATGNVTFIIGNMTKTVEIINGKATAIFKGLNAGTYKVKATYLGNSVYSKSEDEKSFNILKAQSTIKIITSEVDFNKNIRIWAIVNDDATGTVTFRILGLYSPRNRTIVDGNASWLISPLSSGSYVVVATYNGDNNYLSSNVTYIITLNQTRSILNVSITATDSYSDVLVDVVLKLEDGTPITGNVTLKIEDNYYKIIVKNGLGFRNLGKFQLGDYNFEATFKGNETVSRSIAEGSFKVGNIDSNVILIVDNVTMIYHDGSKVIAILTDKNNNPIANAEISFTINNVTYNRVTNSEGKAFLTINLVSGVYDVSVAFNGMGEYTPNYAHAKVTVEPTVKGLDIVKMFRNATQYYAIFTDSNGNILKNVDVKFNINGVFYTRKTNDQGVAKLNINLIPGTFIITAINTVTGEESSNSVKVLPLFYGNKDITKYYRNGTQYSIRLLNEQGKAVGEGEIVTFNINGVFYKRTTNADGVATLNINLNPGKFVITAQYRDCMVSNNIKVLPVLLANDLNMKYHDGSSFKTTLLDGQGKPYSNQQITFNVNGVMYNRITDAKGIASLKINLMAGKYIITSMYGDYVPISNTISIY